MDMSVATGVGVRAAEVAELALRSGEWLVANPKILRQDPATAAREFRRYSRRAERLRIAADRPMCVAVFGASQAGKSYLVSRLAAPIGQPLMTRLGDRSLNFLSDINPPGGQEATGLVTRFTMRVPAGPPDAPVAVRLLSQTDVVKIFANTFLEDFDIDVELPDETALEREFQRLSQSAGAVPRDGLTGDDVEDMVEYFERHFRNHALVQALNRVGFWPRVVDLAPRLPAPERAALFAPLWGGAARFTEACRSLIQALQTLSFPETAFCGLEALVPRETSIIDVRMLFGLGGPPGESVRVSPVGGTPGQVDRVLLTALVAEITVPLDAKPWAFFDHTDLLDFPGARTREVIGDMDKFLAQPEKLGRAFLRGKVAYLFQRYNAEQEITSMLLCVGPSNQEVQTLPGMVQDWINLTIGGTPEARARQPNSLFLVLTKFDSEFEDKAGEDVASGTRWTARMQASLLDFFGKTQDWPRTWTPDKPFDNTFWLRNPAIGFDAVFDYDPPPAPGEPRLERGVSPRAADAVAARRTAYLANDLVRQYIGRPDEAWDEALRPNDGGITRLADALAPVCDPSLKAGQVSARTEELARVMADRLRPYYRSDDREAEKVRARQQAGEVIKRLVDCARMQRFGALLRALQITTEEIAAIQWQMETEPDDEPMPIGTISVQDDYEKDLDEIFGDTIVAEKPARTAPRDRFERFTDLVLGAWDEKRLQAFASDPATHTAFRLPPEQAAILVGQLSTAARRVDLRSQIAEALRQRAIFGGRVSAGKRKAELVLEETINNFAVYLGFDQVVETRRPQARDGRRIFAARAPISGLPPLGPTPVPYDFTFQTDWMRAFAQLMEDNVADPAAQEVDSETNDALGALIKRLAAGARG
jgi:hypothetical protein